jgi:hypothetical protein
VSNWADHIGVMYVNRFLWFLVFIAFAWLIACVGFLWKVRELTDQIETAKTELSVAIVEKQTCEKLVERGQEEARLNQEAFQSAIQSANRCMFNCDERDCLDRCQGCYRLVYEVQEILRRDSEDAEQDRTGN